MKKKIYVIMKTEYGWLDADGYPHDYETAVGATESRDAANEFVKEFSYENYRTCNGILETTDTISIDSNGNNERKVIDTKGFRTGFELHILEVMDVS